MASWQKSCMDTNQSEYFIEPVHWIEPFRWTDSLKLIRFLNASYETENEDIYPTMFD